LTPDRPTADRFYGFTTTCNRTLLSAVVDTRRGLACEALLTIAAAARGGPPGRG